MNTGDSFLKWAVSAYGKILYYCICKLHFYKRKTKVTLSLYADDKDNVSAATSSYLPAAAAHVFHQYTARKGPNVIFISFFMFSLEWMFPFEILTAGASHLFLVMLPKKVHQIKPAKPRKNSCGQSELNNFIVSNLLQVIVCLFTQAPGYQSFISFPYNQCNKNVLYFYFIE